MDPACLEFDTELVSLNLLGGPFAMPLASDPDNDLGDSVEGYGFVDSQVEVTLSSQRPVSLHLPHSFRPSETRRRALPPRDGSPPRSNPSFSR